MKPIDEELRKRQFENILAEIIQTEKDYVNDLNVLNEGKERMNE